MKINKHTALAYNLFLISPFASIPFILIQLRKGTDKGVCLLVSLLIGILSMRYVPSFTNDKVRYIERNEFFTYYSFTDLINYFTSVSRPDYIFDYLNFLYSKLHLDIRFFFLIITTISIYLTLRAIKSILQYSVKNEFTYNNAFIIFFISSLSLANVMSGLRFFFAGSIFLWFIYYFLFRKKILLSIILCLIVAFTHFSYLLLTVGVVAAYYLRPNTKLLKAALVASFLSFLITPNILVNAINLLPIPELYFTKVALYTDYDVDYSANAIILRYIQTTWYYLALIFLVLSKPKENILFYYLIVIFAILINLMYPIPVVFLRYISFFKILFAVYLINLKITHKISNKVFILFLMLYILGFLVELFILRINIITSYFSSDMLYFFSVILNTDGLYDYLYLSR